MFLGVTGMLTCMSYTPAQRKQIADAVHKARNDKQLDKEPAARIADVNSITWKRVEDALGVRDASLSKILTSLELPSAADIIAGRRDVTIHVPRMGAEGPDLEQMSDDDLLAELCRRLKERHQPQHAVPLTITRSPYAPSEDAGVGGDEEIDHRRQFGSS